MDFGEAYDISVLLGEEDAVYPGDATYRREQVSSIESGANYALSTLHLSAHSGTHIDAPAHYLAGKRTIDSYPAGHFILPARVVSIRDRQSIKSSEIEGIEAGKGEALLFKTENSVSGLSRSGSFRERFVYLTKDAAELCVKMGLKLVGIDYISIDRFGDEEAPAHHRLLSEGILILEGIDLKDVPSGRYILICLPLKIKDGDAAPVRAVLLRGENS